MAWNKGTIIEIEMYLYHPSVQVINICLLFHIVYRCLMDNDCHAYQYQHKGIRAGNCILIHSTEGSGVLFGNSDNSETLIKGRRLL